MTERFPGEIWIKVFGHLTQLQDLLNVHLTCHEFARLCNHLVYRHLKITWADLDKLQSHQNGSDIRGNWVQSIQISEASSSQEWACSLKLPKLDLLHFNELRINCGGICPAWLNFIDPPMLNIETLELCVPFKKGVEPFFIFEHIRQSFPRLKTLRLRGYRIEGPEDSDNSLEFLEELELEDCRWDFPTKLAIISQRLKTLKINLTNPNVSGFVLSERLQHDCTYIPPTLETFHLNLSTPDAKFVNWKPLREGSDSLVNLELRGFPSLIQDLRLKLPKLVNFEQHF